MVGSWSVLRRKRALTPPQCRRLLWLLLLAALTVITVAIFSFRIAPPTPRQRTLAAEFPNSRHDGTEFSHFQPPQLQIRDNKNNTPGRNEQASHENPDEVDKAEEASKFRGPYHDWNLFEADYREMVQQLKIFVYPDVWGSHSQSPFAHVFLPHPNPFNNPKVGNYLSEHAFKAALLQSSFITHRPDEAHFFFMPFSINTMRTDPHLHSESNISDFVAQYVNRISSQFKYWNASRGADHFYLYCHSVGREAASKHLDLRTNAIQITCSSSYFQRFYVAHKDVGLPQVWPRGQSQPMLNPPEARTKLVFFAGRVQNSRIRQELLALWGSDPSMDITSGNSSYRYEDGLSNSRYCLHVKGYEVNTARVSDAIHHGCIPVLISNYYELPFSNVLDWSVDVDADADDVKYGFERPEMHSSKLSGTVDPTTITCSSTTSLTRIGLLVLRTLESHPLPKLLAGALKARKKDINVKMGAPVEEPEKVNEPILSNGNDLNISESSFTRTL